jgi:hypothetical protein
MTKNSKLHCQCDAHSTSTFSAPYLSHHVWLFCEFETLQKTFLIWIWVMIQGFQWWRQLVSVKHQYISTRLHGVWCQKTVIFIVTDGRMSEFTYKRSILISLYCGSSLPMFLDNRSVPSSRITFLNHSKQMVMPSLSGVVERRHLKWSAYSHCFKWNLVDNSVK